MSATDARVGQRLAQGMNITEATREGDAESNMMVDRDEDYNTRYGGYKGSHAGVQADEADSRAAGRDRSDGDGRRRRGADTADKVVDHFVHRFLRVPLADKDRAVLVDFLRGKLGTSSIRPGEKLETRSGSCCISC